MPLVTSDTQGRRHRRGEKKSFAASQVTEGGTFIDLKGAAVMCEPYSKQDTLALRERHIG